MKKGLISLLMVLLAVPAMAFDIEVGGDKKVSIYGSIRTNLYYDMSEGTNKVESDILHIGMQGNSRFGFNFDLGQVYGKLEMGANPTQATVGENMTLRHLYAGYRMDNGVTLQLGNTLNIAQVFVRFSDIWNTDNGLAGYGVAAGDRSPMLIAMYGGLQVAMIAETDTLVVTNATLTAEEQFLPRFEASYEGKAGDMSYYAFAGFSHRQYKATDGAGAARIVEANSIVAGAFAKYNMGDMYVQATGFWALNGDASGVAKIMNTSATGLDATGLAPVYVAGKNEIESTTSFGAAAEFGYTISPMIKAALMAGYQMNSNDGWSTGDKTSYAVSAVVPVTLAKGFTLKPSVGYFAADFDKAGDASEILAGAQLRFDF